MKTTKDGIGLGLMKLPFNNKEVYGHGGGIDGFSSIAVHFPKEEITAAYIANTSDYPMNGLFQGAVKIILGMEYDLPNFSPVKTLKLEGLEKYTGIYSGPGFPVEITISN